MQIDESKKHISKQTQFINSYLSILKKKKHLYLIIILKFNRVLSTN